MAGIKHQEPSLLKAIAKLSPSRQQHYSIPSLLLLSSAQDSFVILAVQSRLAFLSPISSSSSKDTAAYLNTTVTVNRQTAHPPWP